MGLIRPKACRKPNSLPGRAWGVRALDSLGAQRAPDLISMQSMPWRSAPRAGPQRAWPAWTSMDTRGGSRVRPAPRMAPVG